MSNQDLCTSRKAAELLGVTPRTIQLWADAGILHGWKTPGGHRRFSLGAIERLAEKIRSGEAVTAAADVVRPEPTRPVRLQVIEDEPALQRLYALTIRSWGLPVELRQSVDGYQGLLELGRFEPDLLILDLNLPNVDGFSVIQALVRQELLQQMQLIVVTALGMRQVQDRIDAISRGIEVLPKPIPFARLREKVEQILLGMSDQI
ncbi:response regulator receiver protein [Marinobacterium iners]|uniref:response regulator n=1 Tax=Marinobacterium iners TaxID=48076 RepID=UPI001A8CBF64|nr:response regulator [Marinobacterium iners]QSR35970.1 response regulator receiver protein [Marinobacterium iners]